MSTEGKRHHNRGLRKVCGCSRRAWLKCEHSWYLNFRYQKGKHHRISLDKHAARHLSKDEAMVLAETLRVAIRNGEYPPVIAPAPATPSDVTFSALGELWLTRERQERVADWKSDRSRLSRLGAIALEDGSTLGTRAGGRITADDLEVACRALEAEGLDGQTLNKYLQRSCTCNAGGERSAI